MRSAIRFWTLSARWRACSASAGFGSSACSHARRLCSQLFRLVATTRRVRRGSCSRSAGPLARRSAGRTATTRPKTKPPTWAKNATPPPLALGREEPEVRLDELVEEPEAEEEPGRDPHREDRPRARGPASSGRARSRRRARRRSRRSRRGSARAPSAAVPRAASSASASSSRRSRRRSRRAR